MIAILAICVTITFGVSIYMMLGRELKGLAMGVFLLGHAANLSIIAMSGSPIIHDSENGATMKTPPVLTDHVADAAPLTHLVDPLPQALILTAIVIGFGVMGFLLALLVVTARKTRTLGINELAEQGKPTPSQAH